MKIDGQEMCPEMHCTPRGFDNIFCRRANFNSQFARLPMAYSPQPTGYCLVNNHQHDRRHQQDRSDESPHQHARAQVLFAIAEPVADAPDSEHAP